MLTARHLLTRLHALADPIRAVGVARFFKTGPGEYGAGDKFLGLTMPQQRALAREFRELPLPEAEHLLGSPWHESRAVALVIWTLQFAKAGPAGRQAIYERYLNNRRFVNNWDLVDISCPTIVGGYLQDKNREPLYKLAAENHLWSQRISIVSTLAFIRKGQFQDTFAIAELLLTHRHDLIQKAVGWMLREVGKRNEAALEEFLTDHHGQLPRTTLRYATERLPTERRAWHMRK
ncbi:DNA alkylation repair protein [Hymenobacter rigui]|uniref:DNA alkylation repair protein n=1 Tax=Hymenobacter rigui TaxID=334424 RepID=A0A3R9MTV7_9BACT|nr:DNA alkylation repair protein [Hymenobacter rigui]RSK48353.1 DNA alkylation repair protein [Hymenobacter rigui]